MVFGDWDGFWTFVTAMSDVRGARAQWAEWNIPYLSKTMDFFASMVQFAQDDAEALADHGAFSREGARAMASLVFNTFMLVGSLPSIAAAGGKVVLEGAAHAIPTFNTARTVGNLRFIARFQTTADARTALEPFWVGVERASTGVGFGHFGINTIGGAHIAAGPMHIYPTHYYTTNVNGVLRSGSICLPIHGITSMQDN